MYLTGSYWEALLHYSVKWKKQKNTTKDAEVFPEFWYYLRKSFFSS